MYKSKINTEQKPASQQSLCSTIGKKLCLICSRRDYKDENECSWSTPEQKGNNVNSHEKRKKDDKESNKHQVKHILKKLVRTTPCLSKAVQSPCAYGKGKNNCETCCLDKETYRSMLQSVKVIELIVDDVISKVQKEMLDDAEKSNPNFSTEKKERTKVSLQFEVFCQKDIEHNLKCVVVKLQKVIGDVLLQMCFCKLKNISEGDKCKKYDVSARVLEQLKFEYITMKNYVIQLLGQPVHQKSMHDICVACIKEEMTECTEILQNMLKTGHKLKVSMRNDFVGNGKCCTRTYPHVHAIVRDKHVVLKFQMPSQDPLKSSKCDLNKPATKSKEDDIANPCPYDEWPEYFQPKQTEDFSEPLEEKSSFQEEEPKKMSYLDEYLDGNLRNTKRFSTISVRSLENVNLDPKTLEEEQSSASKLPNGIANNPLKEDEAPKMLPNISSEDSVSKSSQIGSNSSKNKDSQPGFKTSRSRSSEKHNSVSKHSRSLSNASEKDDSQPNPKVPKSRSSDKYDTKLTQSRVLDDLSKENSLSSTKLSKSKSSVLSSTSTIKSSESKTKSNDSPKSEMFCGCNFDEIGKKLMKDQTKYDETNLQQSKPSPVEQNKDKDDSSQKPTNLSDIEQKENEVIHSKNPIVEKTDSENTVETLVSTVDSGSNDSFTPMKRQKQVSFNPDGSKSQIFYMGGTTHSIFQTKEIQPQSIFRKPHNHEPLPSIPTMSSSLKIDGSRKSAISAVDSVVLVKNKYSLLEKSKIPKELKQSTSVEKSSLQAPQNEFEIKKTLPTKPIVPTLDKKSSTKLNKQQISEILFDLGAENLLSVSLPAECCKNNKSINNFKFISDLPYSASLDSLPLDQNDVDKIKKAVENLKSSEDNVLASGCDCTNEWKMKYRNGLEKEDISEWHSAFTAKDISSNICIDLQTNKPVTIKRIPKNLSSKEIPNLPTITEEEEVKSRGSSQSMNKYGNRKVGNKSGTTKSTELRYFTVEYPNVLNGMKISGDISKKEKSRSCNESKGIYAERLSELDFQTCSFQNIEEVDKELINCIFPNLSRHSTKTHFNDFKKAGNLLPENYLKGFNENCGMRPIDKMLMLDVIYLSSNQNVQYSLNASSVSNSSPLCIKNLPNQISSKSMNFKKKKFKTPSNLNANWRAGVLGEETTKDFILNNAKHLPSNNHYYGSDISTSKCVYTHKNSHMLNENTENKYLENDNDIASNNNSETTYFEKGGIQNCNTENDLQNLLINKKLSTNTFDWEETYNNKNTFISKIGLMDVASKDFAKYERVYQPLQFLNPVNTILLGQSTNLEKHETQKPFVLTNLLNPNNIKNTLVIRMNPKHHVLNLRSYVIRRKSAIEIVEYNNSSRNHIYRRFKGKISNLPRSKKYKTGIRFQVGKAVLNSEMFSENNEQTKIKKDVVLPKSHNYVKDLQKQNCETNFTHDKKSLSKEGNHKSCKNKSLIIFDERSSVHLYSTKEPSVNHDNDKNCSSKDNKFYH